MTCRNSIVTLLSKPILKFTAFGKNLSGHYMPVYSQRAPNFSTYLLWILHPPWLSRGMIVKFIKPNEFLFYRIQPNPHPPAPSSLSLRMIWWTSTGNPDVWGYFITWDLQISDYVRDYKQVDRLNCKTVLTTIPVGIFYEYKTLNQGNILSS